MEFLTFLLFPKVEPSAKASFFLQKFPIFPAEFSLHSPAGYANVYVILELKLNYWILF